MMKKIIEDVIANEKKDNSTKPKKTKKRSQKEEADDDASYLDDPEGIAIPWEEKYGKKSEDSTTDSIKKEKGLKFKGQRLKFKVQRTKVKVESEKLLTPINKC